MNRPLHTIATLRYLLPLLAVGVYAGCSAGVESRGTGPGAVCQLDEECEGGQLCSGASRCVPSEDPSPFDCEGECGAGAPPFGQVLAIHRGVPAYSNGPTIGCHSCDESPVNDVSCGNRCGSESWQTTYGLAYQCVEYVRRFYGEVYGDDVVGYDRGHACAYQGDKVAALGLEEHVNGATTVLPRSDDLIVFTNGPCHTPTNNSQKYGHIAIVTRIEPEEGRLWIIQQNVGGNGEMWLPYHESDGQIVVDTRSSLAGYEVHGWLRNPAYDNLVCSPTLPCPEGYTCNDSSCEPIDCPAPSASTGSIDTPPDGQSQSGAFTVRGAARDGNGIDKVTIAVDALSDCKFSTSPPAPAAEDFAYELGVDPTSCDLQPGPHIMGLWLRDGCGLDTLVDSRVFAYESGDCEPSTTCCNDSGGSIPAGTNSPGCSGECSRCDGAGSCEPSVAGSSCGGGLGACDGMGGCDVPTCNDGSGTVDAGEQCDGANLSGQSCGSEGFDGGVLGCNANCTLDVSECYNEGVAASPGIGNWTPNFSPNTMCSCEPGQDDCRTLYRGRVTSIVGNVAQMDFQKTDGTGPSANVSYWVVVGDDDYPSCTDLNAFVERASGVWTMGDPTLQVGVDIWPSQAAFEAAACGDTKKLFVISGGGGGYENQRLWFQRQAVVFTKTCG